MSASTSSMSERARLERAVVEDREALLTAVAELEQVSREQLDPRHHIAARPRAWLTTAALVGFWLGSRSS